MNIKKTKVKVTLKNTESISKQLAKAELAALYSKPNARILFETLEKDGITEETLVEYYTHLQWLVAAFAADRRTSSRNLAENKFKFSDLRNLYLPTLMATVLSQVGDCTFGNFEIEVEPDLTHKIDRTKVLEMSLNLQKNVDILYSNQGQIGNFNAEINVNIMGHIITAVQKDNLEIDVQVFNGINPDPRETLIAGIAGINLVNETYNILYTGFDTTYYAKLSDVLKTTVHKDE